MDDKAMKGPLQTTHTPDSPNSIELANTVAVGEKHGTYNDETDMDRMGKLQVLRVSSNKLSKNSALCLRDQQRQFKFFSIFGFAVILGNTWEYSLM
jgi:choline transport protein